MDENEYPKTEETTDAGESAYVSPEYKAQTVGCEDELSDSLTSVCAAESNLPVVSRDKKEKNIIKKLTKAQREILLMCLICALIGSIAGGTVTGLIVSGRKKTEPENSGAAGVAANITESQTVVENYDSENENRNEPSTAKTGESVSPQTTFSRAEVTTKNQTPIELSAKQVYSENVDSVVSIEAVNGRSKGYGTGFIIYDAGYVVTNYHVVNGAQSITIYLHDDSQYTATVVGYEENNDVAVLKFEPKQKVKSVIYGRSSDLSVGDPVYIIGNPLGDLTFTLTSGVVSALNRLIRGEDGMSINMFQTDAAVNNGNSGGPVFNSQGRVVGIASAKYASASIEGLGFCIPIDDVDSMINEIVSNGYVSGKPLMGVSVYDRYTQNYGILQSVRSINGAKVAAVGEGTPAAECGIQVDDIITAADGEEITSVSELRTVLSKHKNGDTLTLTVYRAEAEKQITIKLGEYRPASPRTQYSNVYDL